MRWSLGLLLVLSFALRAGLGSIGLNSSRHWDERFTLNNVHALLAGNLTPVNAYYPGLSYLPQTLVLAIAAGLHRATGLAVLSPYGGEAEPFSPTAYLLCRWLSAAYGTLSLWLLYRLGLRLWGPWTGLAAAAILAAAPAHVTASSLIKPDILVVLLTVAAAGWGLTAVEAGRTRPYLAAGAGVGMAVAAKYTGVGAAFPLLVGTLWGRPLAAERWKRLAFAGAASLAAFALLNPWLGLIFRFLPRLASIYRTKGELAGGSHLEVFAWELRFLFRHHGPVLAVLALAALAALAAAAIRAPEPVARRRAAFVVAFPLGYSLLYGLATTLFKGQNYLAVTVFTSLAAGWAIVEIGRRCAARWPVLARPAVAGLLAVPAVVLLFRPPVLGAYRDAVPDTHSLAARLVVERLTPLDLRQVYFERHESPLRAAAGGVRPAMVPVADLSAVDPAALDRADAEVFPVARLAPGEPDFHSRRLAGPLPAEVHRLEPAPFAAHGPALAVVIHPWRLLRQPEALALAAAGSGNRFAAMVEPAGPGELWSLSLEVQDLWRGAGSPTAEVAGRRLALHLNRSHGRWRRYLTPRFEPPASGSLDLALPGFEPLPEAPRARLARWRPPERDAAP